MSVIAFDTSTASRDTSHTVTTLTSSAITIAAANEILFGFMLIPDAQGTGTMTFNGVSMTELPTVSPLNIGIGRLRAFYLFNPSTGSNTGVADYGESAHDHYIAFAAYKNVASTQPDNKASNSNSASTTITGTLTTVADNAWTTMIAYAGNGGLTAGTGSTLRGSIIGSGWGIFDSNGVIHPAGSTSQTVNTTSGGSGNGVIIISIDPGNYSATVTESPGVVTTETLVGVLGFVGSTTESVGTSETLTGKIGFSEQQRSSTTWTKQTRS